MKCFALGLSTASIVLLAALEGSAQNAAPPAEPATPPPPAPATTEAPAQTPPPAQPPATAATNPAPTNPVDLAPVPQTNPAPTPVYPYAPYPYSTGYPSAHGAYGWGLPSELPKELAYSGGAIPRGYEVEERYNMGLLIAGPTLFALGYAVAIFTATEKDDTPNFNGTPDRRPWNVLYVPITGPFAFTRYAPEGSAFIYFFEGLAQVCGVGLFLGGILKPKEVLVRKNSGAAFHPTLRVGPRQMQLEMRF